jgi:hypothetical protein
MNDMHWRIRTLKERWAEEDAARDNREERARQLFLEAEANQTFTPIEEFLIRLSKVLSGAGASVEIDTWQHLDDQRLRRVAQVVSSNPPQRLSLDFTIHGMSIIYHDKIFRFDSGIAALILAITAEVEHSLTPHRKAAGSSSVS